MHETRPTACPSREVPHNLPPCADAMARDRATAAVAGWGGCAVLQRQLMAPEAHACARMHWAAPSRAPPPGGTAPPTHFSVRTSSMGMLLSSCILASACLWAAAFFTLATTARSATHSLQSLVARTVAARGALCSSASSPKELQRSRRGTSRQRALEAMRCVTCLRDLVAGAAAPGRASQLQLGPWAVDDDGGGGGGGGHACRCLASASHQGSCQAQPLPHLPVW